MGGGRGDMPRAEPELEMPAGLKKLLPVRRLALCGGLVNSKGGLSTARSCRCHGLPRDGGPELPCSVPPPLGGIEGVGHPPMSNESGSCSGPIAELLGMVAACPVCTLGVARNDGPAAPKPGVSTGDGSV